MPKTTQQHPNSFFDCEMSAEVTNDWPSLASSYKLGEEIGRGGSAAVYRGERLDSNQVVAIKIVDLEASKVSFDVARKEIKTLGTSQHPNIVQFFASFLVEDKLWLVMDFMAGGSVVDIMNFKFDSGLEEVAIATIMRETLKGLTYFHGTRRIHRDVKAGNILISCDGDVKLADLGVAKTLEEANSTKTFVGTPCWMAPEVMEQQASGHTYSADIWSFGITAMELAHGQAPFAQYTPMKVMVIVIKNPPPTLTEEEMKSRGFSKSFKALVDACLQKDPAKRPTSAQLLDHRFFKQAKKPDYIANNLLDALPPLERRYAERRRQERQKVSGNDSKKKKKGSKSAVPEDDLASDDENGWDFGEDELDEAERAANETRNETLKDAPSSKKSKRAGKSKRVKGDKSKRKGSRAEDLTPVFEIVAAVNKQEAPAETETKVGRFTVVEESDDDAPEPTESTKKSRKSSSSSLNANECANCESMSVTIAKLKKENKELKQKVKESKAAK